MRSLHNFQAVAPRVMQENPGHARFLVGAVGDMVGVQLPLHGWQVSAAQSRVPFLARHKVGRHPNMNLASVGQGEPHAAIFLQGLRLLQFS